MAWLLTWLSNPLMLGVGAAAVLSPIIIHLLNKRRFKIVDWAAMDFLFDADKKNRRRVKLENFILLLLRCLAMLLLGLLLAKPFLPSGTFGNSQQYQRIVLLDDSLSQRVKVGNQSAFAMSKDRIKQLLQKLAGDGNSDFLTLYLTSDPEKPLIANEPVTVESLDTVISQIDDLKCSDRVAGYVESLGEIRNFVENDHSTNNQVVYVMTDLRRRDWQGAPDDENSPGKLVAEIAELTPNTFVVDVGSSLQENLAVTNVSAEDLLVAGTIVRFNVSVRNFGETTAENVEVKFRVDDFQSQTEMMATIAPGKTEQVTFRYLFPHDSAEFESLDFDDRLSGNLENARVHVEIVQQGSLRDSLIEDSEGFFAARTLKALPVLIVDGDPSSVSERGEAHYLKQLGVSGTGILVDTATVGEFETISLTRYKAIFLCNVDEASPDRVLSLRQWVEDGGGLVFMPGDRVRASTFNETFHKDGEGLSPMKLEVMEGDVNRTNWVYMEVSEASHPALRVALDEEIGFDNVEIFSWWRGSVKAGQQGVVVSTPLVMGNQDKTPAMADKVVGEGRAVTYAFPADADWTMWPADPTYICVMWDLVNDLVHHDSRSSGLRVGGKIHELVDLSQYDLRVALTDPEKEKIGANARPIEEGQDSILHQVEFPNVSSRGFYELEFSRDNVAAGKRLFAVNTDPDESDLRRMDVANLRDTGFFGENAIVLGADEMVLQNESSSSNEIWPQILLLLAGMLLVEQLLGWWFGRKR